MRYQRSGDDVEVFDGPMVDFPEHPASNFTGKDFIYLDTAYKELTGNAFWELLAKNDLSPLIPRRSPRRHRRQDYRTEVHRRRQRAHHCAR
jgi:hypothetical protein